MIMSVRSACFIDEAFFGGVGGIQSKTCYFGTTCMLRIIRISELWKVGLKEFCCIMELCSI